jgi:enoyl-CoA hydratase
MTPEADGEARVLLKHEPDGVRILILNRPERRNSIDPAMRDELDARLSELEADGDARVLVVTGRGPSFCAGADLSMYGRLDAGPRQLRDELERTYALFLRVRALPYPSICAVSGHAIGAGLNLALACDIRFAGSDASFGATFTRLGIHPGGGATFFLVDAMGYHRALHCLLRGEALDANAACEAGLVEQVHADPFGAAVELARHVATLDPQLVTDIKRATRTAHDFGLQPTVQLEGWAQASTMSSPSFRERVTRPPKQRTAS